MTPLNRLLIRDRLNLLVLVPLSLVLLMTVPFVADRVQDARQASTTATLVGTARQLGSLVQELERERLLSIAYLASPGGQRNPLVVQAQAVGDEVATLRGSLTGGQSPGLQTALAKLRTLSTLRTRVLRRNVSPQAVNAGFGAAIGSLVDALGLSQGVAAGSTGARQQTALDALLRSDEENSSAGAGLLAMVAQARATADVRTAVASAARLAELEAGRFQQLAKPAQVELFRAAESGPAADRVDRLRGRLLGNRLPARERERAVLASEIFSAVESESGLRRMVQDKIARDIAVEAQRAATRARLAGLAFGGLAIVLLVAVVLLSVAIGRSIARPLRRLTVAAGKVADLAQAELIRVTDEEGEEDTPVKLAAVEVSAEDEIGDLAAALNRVQATAALLLERQVASRRNIASMFGSVGRRTQNLVGRQLSMIDALERNEQNLELLQRLYRLDHLSARLRRHADSLVVLSGTAEPMLVTAPLSVGDVIRSALGEIEDFQRVRLVDVVDARVVPHITRDLKLLIAELLEERHLVLTSVHRRRGDRSERGTGLPDRDRRPRRGHASRPAGGGERPAETQGTAGCGPDRRTRPLRRRAAVSPVRHRCCPRADIGRGDNGAGQAPVRVPAPGRGPCGAGRPGSGIAEPGAGDGPAAGGDPARRVRRRPAAGRRGPAGAVRAAARAAVRDVGQRQYRSPRARGTELARAGSAGTRRPTARYR